MEKLIFLQKEMDVEDPELPSSAFEGPVKRAFKHGIRANDLPIYHAVQPGGCTRLLKTVLTTSCENDCAYCGMRSERDTRRVAFRQEEMADIFLRLFAARKCDGLFLSSGIAGGGQNTQERIIQTARIVRARGFRGYLHLKIMPGAAKEQVRRTMLLADRVSINLEAPTTACLARLAPRKRMAELFHPLEWVDQIRREESPHEAWKGRWPSSSTQFVVGAVEETDRDLLTLVFNLHRRAGLRRTYFSAFSPVDRTPLAEHRPGNPLRSHRLYQSEFLMRDYGFSLEEIIDEEDCLPLDVDPKLRYARRHLTEVPIDLDRADYRELIRVPGIGPGTARKILASRSAGQRIRELGDLTRLGASAKRAEPFVLINGRNSVQQLRLF